VESQCKLTFKLKDF
jgi:hypothetical protein